MVSRGRRQHLKSQYGTKTLSHLDPMAAAAKSDIVGGDMSPTTITHNPMVASPRSNAQVGNMLFALIDHTSGCNSYVGKMMAIQQ